MFNRILVPLDGSPLAENVLPHVAAVARRQTPEIFLLRVLDPIGAVTRPNSVDPFDWQVRKAEAEAYLKNIAVRLTDLGLRVTEKVLEGRAAETVIEFARNENVDLILLSSHGQSGISGWNVSSVVQKIILRASVSVMIVRSYQGAPEGLGELKYERILVPLDGSPRAAIALPIAKELAHSHESSLLLVHVVEKPEMPRHTPLSAEDQELAEKVTERNRLEATRYLADVQSRLGEVATTRLQIAEHVKETLHTLVEQEQADLVILSAHGYSGATRWPYGTTVISFIAYGTTPLLIVQDLAPDMIEPSQAEIAAREQGRR